MADGNNAISTNSSLPMPQQQPTKLGSRSIDGKISKHGNVIHRTTSESLRLGGGNGDQLVGPPSTKNTNSSAARNAKTSSFQITSVTTAINIRTPADNGDDSADDLDESHTDDNSRITDHENETPSISEDTFSKEDVFFSSHAIGSAPVIPTSSQYGLAIVAPNLGGPDGQMISDVHVSVTDGGLNIVGCSSKHDVDMKDMNHRNERFKVVKIESTEPFKRGRWMCMDYLDHTTLQPTNPSGDGNNENNVDFENPNMDSPNKTVQTEIHLANVINQNLMPGQSAAGGYPLSASTSPGQTLSQPLNPNSLLGATASIASDVANNPSSHASPSTLPNPTVQSMSSQQVSPVITQTVQPSSTSQSSLQHQDSLAGNVNSLPMQDIQQIPNMQQQQQQQVQSQPTQFHGGGSQQQQQQQQHHQHQGQTLPASVLHNITNSHPNPSHVTSQPHQAMSMGHMSQSPQLINQPNFTQSPQPLQPTIASIINPTQQSQQPLVIQSQLTATQQQPGSIASPVPQSQQPSVQQVSQPNYSPSTGTIASGVLIPSSANNVSNSVPNVINGNIGNGIGSAVNVNVDEGASGGISSGYLSPAGAAGSVSASVSAGDVAGTQSAESMIEGPNQTATTGSSGTGTTEDGAPTEDSESVSRPVNALISNSDLIPPSHYAKNQRIPRSKPHLADITSENSVRKIPQAESNVFTKLALGNCMENLMKTSRQSLPKQLFSVANVARTDDSSGKSSSIGPSIPHKSVQNLKREESIGIPIPPRRNNSNSHMDDHLNRYAAFMNSPTSGRFSPSNLMYGSPTISTSPASPVQSGYLEAYGSSGSGKVSRAASPQPPLCISVGGTTGCGDYSASGTSAVAIDNKIEQAMDLVKSHLMFAVREEVEVLKEKIAELMDRINQLEFENNILKANATQETLTQLSTIAPPKPLQNPNPANGPVS